MLSTSLYAVRNERWIGIGRLSFAAVALIAIYLDPLQPALYAEIGYALLALYLLWSLIAAWSARRFVRLQRWTKIAIHAVDVIIISALMLLTEAETSPFFVFFTFLLLAAMLRWGWQAILVTAAVVMADFLLLSILFNPEPDLLTSLLRSSYLAIIAGMLSIVAAGQERLRADFARLSGRQLPLASPELPPHEILRYVVDVFEAPGALLVWSDPDEPWTYVASLRDGVAATTRESPEVPIFAPHPEGENACLISWDATDPSATLVIAENLDPRTGRALDAGFIARLAIRTLVAAPLPTESVSGHLFILDLPAPTVDHVVMARVIAEQIARHFDLVELLRRLQAASATEEQFRVARDLHDGVLQFLAGTALQVQALRRSLDHDPAGMHEALEDMQRTLAAEQRLLRSFVDDLKPIVSAAPRDLATALLAVAETLEQKWRISIRCNLPREQAIIPETLYRHVQHIVSEAVANAKRHGAASTLDVDIQIRDEALDLSIADNGSGFPFSGRFDLATLIAQERGPRMLLERVRAVGGGMSLTSSDRGARIDIQLPLRPRT